MNDEIHFAGVCVVIGPTVEEAFGGQGGGWVCFSSISHSPMLPSPGGEWPGVGLKWPGGDEGV